MRLTTGDLRVLAGTAVREWPRRAVAALGQSSVLLWSALTLLFLYERTYLIQKAGLPHFVVCTAVRLGLLLGLCYGHNCLLVPRLLARRRYGPYGLLLAVAVGGYLLLQARYDQYLFGYVIGDQERAGLWSNLPYNGLVAGWYLLLTYLVGRRLPTRRWSVEPSTPGALAAEITEIVIKAGGEWVRLPVAHIWYAQGLKDYTVLHTSQGKYLVKGSLGKVAQGLPAGCFLRVHKSYLVARQHIRAVTGTVVVLADARTVPIGRTYAPVLAEFKGAAN